MRVHDPYLEHWWEFEAQDSYPTIGARLARFFRNQEGLKDLKVEKDLASVLRDADAVVMAVKHREYLDLDPESVVEMMGAPPAIIDSFGILSDGKI